MKGQAKEHEIYLFGPYRLIPSERLLLVGEEGVELGARAFDMLVLLVRQYGKVVSRKQILDYAWPDLTVDETNLRFQMSQLRRALRHGSDGTAYITNVRGRGYTFVAPVETASSQPAPISAAGPALWKLPARPQRLVGRRESVDFLHSTILACRFLSIVGAGGIGKTTLGIELAHSLAGEFSNQVCYVDLGALKDSELVLPTVAVALDYTVQSGDLLRGLASFVADRHLLLILDCCEHVIDAAADLAATLFRHAPKVHILATSREPLRADGETIHFLRSLDLPDVKPDLTAAEAFAAPSVQLFMQRAATSGYMGDLQDSDAHAVAEICRQLDGNPLAIELAGSRLITYGFAGLLDVLGGRSILNWPGRRHEPRHRTLEATLDWSFQLLSEIERRVLARLSVFIGSFTMQAAQAVASNEFDDRWTVTRALEELADKSLITIQAADGMNLYRILDVTRIYAEIKLADSGQQPQVMRRLARFCADYLQNANASPAIDGARSRPGELAIGNVRAALDWCFAAEGDIKLGIDLAAGASRMFLDRSMLGECLRWCRTALACIGESEPFSIRTLRLQESLALCLMYTSGNDDRVGGVIERGLEMAAALGARQSELHLLAGQNLYLTRREDFQGALDAAERFAARVGGSTDPVEIVAAEWMLGSTHHLIGRERMGHEILERGFARAETFGIGKVHYFGFDHAGRAAISRAWIAWLCGAPEQAIGHAKQALNASVAQNHPVSLCITYLYTTWVVLWLRDLDWAEDLTEALIELATKHQLKPYLTGGQALKGELLLARDQVKAGITLLQDAIEPLRTEQQTIVLTPTLRAYAEGLARLGQNEEAEKTISDVVNRAETTSPTYMLPELIRTQADVMLARSPGDFDRAQACYRKAITRAQVHGALGWELRAAISLARLLIETGRLEEARDLLQRTMSLFTEGFATRDLLDAQQLLQRC